MKNQVDKKLLKYVQDYCAKKYGHASFEVAQKNMSLKEFDFLKREILIMVTALDNVNHHREIHTNPNFSDMVLALKNDLESAYGRRWMSPLIQKNSKLIFLSHDELLVLSPKTQHSTNFSGDDLNDHEYAEKILHWMKNPIIMLAYDYYENNPDYVSDGPTYYILDGSHRYNEAMTLPEYRMNPEASYDPLPVCMLHLKNYHRDIDPDTFDWIVNKRLPTGNWS